MAFALLTAGASWGQQVFCPNQDTCNLLTNGSFECGLNVCDPNFPERGGSNGTNPLIQHFSHPNSLGITYPNVANNWASSNTGSPDCIISIPNPNTCGYNPVILGTGTARTGQRHLHLACVAVPNFTRYIEGVFQTLNRPLRANTSYELSFWVKNLSATQTATLRVGLVAGATNNVGVSPYLPTNNVNFNNNLNLANSNIATISSTIASFAGNGNNRHLEIGNSNNWQQITIRFITPNLPPNVAHQLVLEAFIPNGQTQTYQRAMNIDDIVLTDLTPQLNIVKRANGEVNNPNNVTVTNGSIITYEIALTTGCQPVNNVVLTDVLQNGLLFVSSNNLSYNVTASTLSTTVSLPANTTTIFKYEAQVLASANCNGNPRIINNNAIARFNNGTNNVNVNAGVSVEVLQNNCQTSPINLNFTDAINNGLLLPSGSPTIQNIVVNGTWRLTGAYVFARGSTIRMGAGAQIIVGQSSTLELDSIIIREAGCNCMWYRILVEPKSKFTITNSTIRDAQYAVETRSDAGLVITNTRFINNFVGIYMAPVAAPLLPTQNFNLATGAFNNNQFSTNQQGLRPYFTPNIPTPVQTGGAINAIIPNVAGGAMAGIYVNDALRLDLSFSFNNTFSDLMAGIVTSRVGIVNVTNANFQSINNSPTAPNPGYPSSILWQGVGVYSRGNNVNGLTVENCNFINSANGVVGNGMNMTVFNTTMTNMSNTGIRANNSGFCTMAIGSNTINANRFGISLLGANNAILGEVFNNNITISPPSGTVGTTAGVFVPNGINGLSVRNNNITCNARAQIGIYVQNAVAAAVNENVITILGGANSIPLNSRRAGVSVVNTLTGANQILVSCNQINPNSSGTNNTANSNIYGILSSTQTGTATFQCNSTNNTGVGLGFESPTANTQIQGNFINNHGIGLLMSSNFSSNTAPATNRGNIFAGTNNGRIEARHEGGNSAIQGYRFFYNQFATNIQSNLPPNPNNLLPQFISTPNVPIAVWFSQSPNQSSNEFDCNDFLGGGANTVCVNNRVVARLANNNINNTDISIANGTYSPVNDADMHINKRNLYRKLRQNQNLSQTMPIMQQFEATEQNTPVGLFDLVTTQTENAMQLSSADSATLASCQTQIQLLSDSIRLVDSLNTAGANDTVHLHAVQNQLAALIQLCDSTANAIQNAKHALLDNTAAATNAAINTAIDVETAEKLVNSIYFNTLAKNIAYFDAAETQNLQLISSQCPDILGNIVYQARAMYALVADVDILSKAGCVSTNNMEVQATNIENVENDINKDIIVFPNPAQNILTLQQSTTFLAGTEVQIYNSLGQLMQSQIITNANKAIELNVSTLVNGSYFVHISNGEIVTSKLFIISK